MKITPRSFGELSKDYIMTKTNQIKPPDFETWNTYFNKLYQPDCETSGAKLEYTVHEVQNIETDAIIKLNFKQDYLSR